MFWHIKQVCDPEQILLMLGPLDFFDFETHDTKRQQVMPLRDTHELYSYLQNTMLPLELDSNLVVTKLIERSIHPRKYVQDSYIDWHRDYDHLPDKGIVEFECILVLSNTSDSLTEFETSDGNVKVRTEAGDLLIVTRRGVRHRVLPVTNHGERVILKFTCM
jgi:hypothetical protein